MRAIDIVFILYNLEHKYRIIWYRRAPTIDYSKLATISSNFIRLETLKEANTYHIRIEIFLINHTNISYTKSDGIKKDSLCKKVCPKTN